jgi:hypothetical protein
MTTATSDVDICNLALDLISEEGRVVDIQTPATDQARVCSKWYDITRRQELRAHPWNFARKRDVLTLSSTSPLFGYPNAYNLPLDYIRLMFIGDDRRDHFRRNYIIENNQLLIDNSNANSINLGYVYDITDVAQFDPLFIQQLVLKLALNLAYKFSLKNTVIRRILDIYVQAKREAKAVDGQESPPKRVQRSKFLAARRNHASSVANPILLFDS